MDIDSPNPSTTRLLLPPTKLIHPRLPVTLVTRERLLRDMDGNNLYYKTNSITLGGGESADVIIDSAGIPAGTYFLYTTNLDHLSNDAENFGGQMTEIEVI